MGSAIHVGHRFHQKVMQDTCSAVSYDASIMARPVYEPGKFANYIAPPLRGINRQPINFEYVRTEA